MAMYWNEEIECMPINELVKLQERKLIEGKVIERAYKSALYRDKWRKLDIKVKGREDLKKFPYITGKDLKEIFEKKSIEEIICSKNIYLWFSTSGTTGKPKWIPYSREEIKIFEETMLRNICVSRRILSKGGRVVIITTPAPFVSSGLFYFSLFAQFLNKIKLEIIPISLANLESCLPFAIAKKPNYIAGYPSLLLRIAELIEQYAYMHVKKRFNENKSFKNLITLIIAKLKGIKPKDLFKLKIGLFGGEPLSFYRKILKEYYGLELFEIYMFTEHPSANTECSKHNGIHLWIDTCIYEIIPKEELDREEEEENYIPKAIFIDEAEPGMKGELVITTFSRILPFIRYRTSDLIEIIDIDRCECGRTHPRIRVLYRRDDIVNLGVIRFSILKLNEQLLKVSKYGKVSEWQLRIKRERYKPKPCLYIKYSDLKDEKMFIDEIMEKILEIEVLKKGCEFGLVLWPKIYLIENFEESRTQTGKLKLVVYEE